MSPSEVVGQIAERCQSRDDGYEIERGKIPGRPTLVTRHCCGDTAASLSDLNERQRS